MLPPLIHFTLTGETLPSYSKLNNPALVTGANPSLTNESPVPFQAHLHQSKPTSFHQPEALLVAAISYSAFLNVCFAHLIVRIISLFSNLRQPFCLIFLQTSQNELFRGQHRVTPPKCVKLNKLT